MILLISIAPLLLAASPSLPESGGDAPAAAVAVDGGAVPIVAPALTEPLAKVLAPSLAPDGGTALDGGQMPIIAPTTLSVYTVDLPAEAAITAASFGLYVMVDVLVKPTLQGDVSCRTETTTRCNPDVLSDFDRYAVGRSSKPWQAFGDIALATSLILPTIYLGLESLALPTREPWGDWAKDLLVVSESMALAAAMDTVLKFSFRRPRPSRYLAEGQSTSFDAELSLPSGHTTLVTAATTALSTTIFFRHPNSQVRFVVLGAGLLLSGLTAWSRVESGQHFPTDVITGLFVGAASGFIVPYLHRRQLPVVPQVSWNPQTGSAMLALSGAL